MLVLFKVPKSECKQDLVETAYWRLEEGKKIIVCMVGTGWSQVVHVCDCRHATPNFIEQSPWHNANDNFVSSFCFHRFWPLPSIFKWFIRPNYSPLRELENAVIMSIFLLFVLLKKSTKKSLTSVCDATPYKCAAFALRWTPDQGLKGLGMETRVWMNLFALRGNAWGWKRQELGTGTIIFALLKLSGAWIDWCWWAASEPRLNRNWGGERPQE